MPQDNKGTDREKAAVGGAHGSPEGGPGSRLSNEAQLGGGGADDIRSVTRGGNEGAKDIAADDAGATAAAAEAVRREHDDR